MLVSKVSNNFTKINFTNFKSQPKRQAVSFGNKLQADSFESSNDSKAITHAEFVVLDRKLKELSPELQKEVEELTQNAQTEVSEICQKIRETIDDVTETYNAIQQGDYQGTAKLVGETLEEFDEDGKLTRKSVFQKGKLQRSTEYDGETINELYNCQGQPIDYRKDVQKFPNILSKSDVDLFWFTGIDEIYYHKNNVVLPNFINKTGFEVVFENGKPTYIQKEYTRKGLSTSSETEITFIDGKWQEIVED